MKRLYLIWNLVLLSVTSVNPAFLQQPSSDPSQTLYIVGDIDEGTIQTLSYSQLQALLPSQSPGAATFILQDDTTDVSVPFTFSTVQGYISEASLSPGPQ